MCVRPKYVDQGHEVDTVRAASALGNYGIHADEPRVVFVYYVVVDADRIWLFDEE